MSDPKFDTEQFLRNAVSLFKAKLNSKITAINSEKGDFVLDLVDSSAWYLNMIPKQFSFPVFVIYGIANEELDDFSEAGILKRVTLQFEIGVADQNWTENEAAVYRLLRYRRAFEEIVSANFRIFGNGKKPIIESLPPASLAISGNRFEFSGINMTIRLDA